MYSLNMNDRLDDNNWITDFKMDKLKSFNKLPMPKWKRISIDKVTIPEYREYNKKFLKVNSNSLGNVMAKPLEEGLRQKEDLKKYVSVNDDYGVSEKFVIMGEALNNTGVLIHAPKGEKLSEPIYVEYKIDEDDSLVIDHNIIVAERDSSITVVIDYKTLGDDIRGFHNGVTKVFAEEGSEVNIIKLQMMNDVSNNFDSNIGFIEGRGNINWISVELGSEISSSSYLTNLNGEASQSDLNSIYLGDKSRKMDLNYTMIHRGSRSISNIETRGALKDKSKKVFRGNLDFKKGSRRSKGVEEEFVILLDPTVKNDAIPALLCEEHDVEGEHAASAGQIDSDKLFYIMSRGLDEREAKKLVVEASYKPIIDKIPKKELHKVITDEIHRRLING